MTEDTAAQEWETALEAARAEHADTYRDIAFALVGWEPPSILVPTAANPLPIVQIALDLGMRLPPITEEFDGVEWAELAQEELGEVTVDLILWSDEDGDPTDLDLWSDQPAVQAGQVRHVAAFPQEDTPAARLESLRILIEAADGIRTDVVDVSTW